MKIKKADQSPLFCNCLHPSQAVALSFRFLIRMVKIIKATIRIAGSIDMLRNVI